MEISIAPAPIENQELEKPESPNLKLLKNAVADYKAAAETRVKNPLLRFVFKPGNIVREDVDLVLSPFGVTSAEFMPVQGDPVNVEKLQLFLDKQNEEIWLRRDKFDRDEVENPEEVYKSTLRAFKAVALTQHFLFSPKRRGENPELYQRMEQVKVELQGICLEALGRYGRDLFGKDIVGKFPYKEGINLAESIKIMATAVSDDDSKKAYQATFEQITKLQTDYENKSNRYISFTQFFPDSFHGKGEAIYRVMKDFSEEEWVAINPTPEQIRALYDVVHEQFLQSLFNGGVESWDGTSASHCFYLMQDPRAIPHMIEYLRHFPDGHTSNQVAYAIEEIVQKPLAQEDLRKVIEASSPLDKRIIIEWLQNSDSIYQLFDGYNKSNFISQAPKYLALEKLTQIAEIIGKQQGVNITDTELRAFFLASDWVDTTKVESLLLQNIESVASVVAASGVADWRIYTPVIFKALVHPENGNDAWFPEIVAREGIKLDEALIAKLRELYNTRDLKVGIMARNAMSEGLLMLSGKENGREIAESILGFVTGAREDSARVREAFRLLQTLDGLGEFSYDPKTTLQETIADLRGKVVTVVTEKMELGEDEKALVSEKLPYLVESNIVEIIPSLLSQMSKLSRSSEEGVVREIGRHIVFGDFKSWREGLEASKEQLSVLAEDKREAWLEPVPEVVLSVQAQKGAEARQATVDAIKRIVSEARAHVQDIYKVDFLPDRTQQLGEMQKTLIGEIKASSSENEKRELGVRKRSVDAELRLIEGFVQLGSASPDSLKPQDILSIAAKTKSAMGVLSGLDQPMRDLDQIEKVFTTQAKLETVAVLRAYDSDDPVALLKAGIEPRETCQSWRGGAFNYCLPACVVDANKRVFNVENERREVLGRAMAKLTHIQTNDGQKQPAILLEPVYTASETPDIYRAIIRLALEKAEAVGAVLVVGSEIVVATGADSSKTVSLLPQEASRAGFNSSKRTISVYLPPSNNTSEYSDTLGGLMSWFGGYHDLNAEVLSK
ncbi:MAG: hypothetical protein A3A58_02545 [Candidatus Blackburnbacteria bacterium RIFCSPLOWO2_01_FULL_41_27]|uniref:Uncharacterized protein n=2 Tax=Candidatus Blackburniibacteriota TaxID=1817898 RepID=A0A1G1V749_9BACT|nr:MAG: hypothetical protein A3F61_03065 [Candidatus Blackburnbacteria bacterium RIFCSPHIGHO2_12_FULL_41_13b]OGY14385.1 MAG: hypothetical protein A3A58_02545 [Candidatus Blackburnbacteria bacterium RIFCSPLOWO2_01_FULL_41_27]